MKTIRAWGVAFSFLLAFASQEALAGDRLKSGLQPGEKITAIFEPVNVTGEHAGEPYCLICENGLSPVVMIFARQIEPALMRLLAKVDAATAEHKKEYLGSFVVFLSDKESLKDELAAAAKKYNLKHTVLAVDAPAGPDGFNVAKEADVTVVLYREHEVKANHAFRTSELTDEARDRILADLPKILAGK